MFVKIKSTDGEGEFNAYLAEPESTNVPGVVLIFEGYGLNAMIKGIADNIASQGFCVICPDLYWRVQDGMQEYEDHDWNYIYDAESVLSEKKAVEDIAACSLFLKHHAGCNGKVSAVGFSLGAKLACIAATHNDIDCAVAYYPLSLEKHLGIANELKAPLLIHLAGKDEHVPLSIREEIKAAFKDNDLVTVDTHENMPHGFARRGSTYFDRDEAVKANDESVKFVLDHLNS